MDKRVASVRFQVSVKKSRDCFAYAANTSLQYAYVLEKLEQVPKRACPVDSLMEILWNSVLVLERLEILGGE